MVRARGQDNALVDIESLTSVESRRHVLEELMSVAALRRQEGDVDARARALNLAGELHLKLNDTDSAMAVASEALGLARRSGDAKLLADTLTAAATIYRSRHDNKTALSLLNEGHDLCVRLNYRRGEAQTLNELGTTYFY